MAPAWAQAPRSASMLAPPAPTSLRVVHATDCRRLIDDIIGYPSSHNEVGQDHQGEHQHRRWVRDVEHLQCVPS